MSQKVKGFLASDGKFFESEPECLRYEYEVTLRELCESHAVNPENFFALLREWSTPIKGYYYADSQCKETAIKPTGAISFEGDDLSHAEDDHADTPFGDKDAPGFLEQSLRRGK